MNLICVFYRCQSCENVKENNILCHNQLVWKQYLRAVLYTLKIIVKYRAFSLSGNVWKIQPYSTYLWPVFRPFQLLFMNHSCIFILDVAPDRLRWIETTFHVLEIFKAIFVIVVVSGFNPFPNDKF